MLAPYLRLVRDTFKETPDITYGDNNFVAKFDRFYVSYSYVDNESFWYLDDVPFDTFPEVLEYGLMTERFTKDDYNENHPNDLFTFPKLSPEDACTFVNEPSAAS